MRFGGPDWWDELCQHAWDATDALWSAAFYEHVRAEYRKRFPDADAASLANLDQMVEWARQREAAA